MNDVFWHFRQIIHIKLGGRCSNCGTTQRLDIHHVNHDGTAIRAMWGLSGPPENWHCWEGAAYFMDMYWGIWQDCNEVILLCRKCHKAHHKKYGYKELVRKPIRGKDYYAR